MGCTWAPYLSTIKVTDRGNQMIAVSNSTLNFDWSRLCTKPVYLDSQSLADGNLYPSRLRAT